MRVGLLNTFQIHRRRRRTVAGFLESDDHDAGILVGHGEEDSFEDMRHGELVGWGAKTHLWLHACRCGKTLGPSLGGEGRRCYGFVTNILAGLQDGIEFEDVVSVFEAHPPTSSGRIIQKAVQSKWHGRAVRFLTNDFDILSAAVMEHLTLSLRQFGE